MKLSEHTPIPCGPATSLTGGGDWMRRTDNHAHDHAHTREHACRQQNDGSLTWSFELWTYSFHSWDERRNGKRDGGQNARDWVF